MNHNINRTLRLLWLTLASLAVILCRPSHTEVAAFAFGGSGSGSDILSAAAAITTTSTTTVATTIPSAAAATIAVMPPPVVVHFTLGAIAGGVGAFVAYPLDFIKSQMQMQGSSSSNNNNTKKYKNGLDAFVSIVTSSSSKNNNDNNDGPLTLFRGLGVQMVGIAPEKGIKLGMNHVLLTLFVTYTSGSGSSATTATATSAAAATIDTSLIPLWVQIMAASLAGFSQVIVTSPLEVIKVNLQTNPRLLIKSKNNKKNNKNGSSSRNDDDDYNYDRTMLLLWDEIGGIPGLFRGAEACILRDVVFTAVLFPLYQCTQTIVPDFPAACLSGCLASFVATPFDFVKTRMITATTTTASSSNTNAVTSMISTTTTSSSITQASTTSSSSIAIAHANTHANNSPRRRRRRRHGVQMQMAGTSSDNDNDNDNDNENDNTKENENTKDKNYDYDRNPIRVGLKIAQQEGRGVMFTGVVERCLGSIPRFGVTLSLYDVLERFAQGHGWM